MPNDFDIIIVGAGLVGSSLALALQNQNFKIAIIEKHLPEVKTMPNLNFRPISLAYSSVEILKTLKVWDHLASLAAPIREVNISQQGVLGGLHFVAEELGVAALGQVVPFPDLHLTLYQMIAQQQNLEIIPINQINTVIPLDSAVALTVDTAKGSRSLRTTLLVAADGAHSTVRDLLNIPTTEKISEEVSLTATLTLDKPYQFVAFERFSKEGTLAILPLKQENQCGLVWTMSAEKSAEIKNWNDTQFIEFITTIFKGRIGHIRSIKKGALFPLETIIAQQQFKANVILLGNAAHTIYPFAAQGFNLGLRDAAALAEILVDAQQKSLPLGSNRVLQNYVEWRQEDQDRIRRLTGGIARLTEMNFPFARRIRGLGLLMTDFAVPLKKRIAKWTMGLAGKLPKLARGLPL